MKLKPVEQINGTGRESSTQETERKINLFSRRDQLMEEKGCPLKKEKKFS